MISYSLYLLHFSLILNVMVTFIDKPTNIREALFLHGLYYVISFVLAHLLYKYFEKPVMDLRSRQGSLWQAIRTGKPAKF
jgi:peptidoglycan/LPS O-acetylase OafA/YrhL